MIDIHGFLTGLYADAGESAMRRRPNGGHGGAGGNVVIQADDRMQNLATATHHFKGGAGLNGMRTSVTV